MRRAISYVVAWAAFGVGAVALATVGVSMVENQVTGNRPAPLSAAQVRAALDTEGATSTSTTSTTATSVPATGVTAPTSPPTTEGSTTPTSVGSGTSVPPTTAPAPVPETRTYTLIGGTATLRFTTSGAELVVASPNPGFAVDVEPTHDNGVRVEFRSETHRSQVEGWWDDGPRDEVDEDEED